MRWRLAAVFFGLLASTAGARPAPAAVRVLVDGVPIPLAAPPQLVDDRVMVPMRGIFERLGATLQYHSSTQVVIARGHGLRLSLGVGSPTVYINRRRYPLDTPAFLDHGRVYIPLRFIAQAFGARVKWHPSVPEVAVWTGLSRPYPPNVLVVVPPAPAPHRENADLINAITFEPRLTALGSVVTVRGNAVPGAAATLTLGDNRSVPMVEVGEGVYQAQHELQLSDVDTDRRPVMHVTMPDGLQDAAQSPVAVPLVVAQRPPPPVLTRVHVNGSEPLHPGQRLIVSAEATPGLTATFSLGRFIFPMVEEASGLYRGEYVVQPSDGVTAGRIMVTVARPDGERASLEATEPVNFDSP